MPDAPTIPTAPPAEPDIKPAPAPGPARPEEWPDDRPQLDPFNPDWPENLPLPQPKA